jgi:class 3 adenylate cyclase
VRGPELGADDPRCPGCGTSVATGQRFCQECWARLPGEGEEPGERRVLTAIFCDMVGSTAMASRLEALAAPGAVLIAGATEEAVRGYVAVEP